MEKRIAQLEKIIHRQQFIEDRYEELMLSCRRCWRYYGADHELFTASMKAMDFLIRRHATEIDEMNEEDNDDRPEKGGKMELTKFTDEDAADLGRALIKAIGAHAYPGWHPAECPSEIVGDLRNECDELRRDAERYRKLRDEDAWGEDTSESGGSRWGELGEMHGAAFDAVVDALPSNA